MKYSIDITASEMTRGYTILNKLNSISSGGRWRYINHSHSTSSPVKNGKRDGCLDGWLDGWIDCWLVRVVIVAILIKRKETHV